MLKIRLRRMGAKFQPHYRIVVADARAPRDGRFVSILGYYDPRTNPATIHLDGDQVQAWVHKGAQPTDAVIGLLRQANLAPEVIAAYNRKNPRKAYTPGQATATAPATTTAAVATTEADVATSAAAAPTEADAPAVTFTPDSVAAAAAAETADQPETGEA